MADFDMNDDEFLASLVSEINTDMTPGNMDDFSLASLEEEMMRDILGGSGDNVSPVAEVFTDNLLGDEPTVIGGNEYNLNDIIGSDASVSVVEAVSESSNIEIDVVKPENEGGKSAQIIIPIGISNSVNDSDDLMSWLDSKAPEKIQSSEIVTSNISSDDLGGVDASKRLPPPSTKGMDSFFDEVFGGDITGSESMSLLPQYNGIEREIGDILRSSFPDISNLKRLIASAGYVPTGLRGQVWSLLLTGSCTEDQEAEFWRSSGMELVNHAELEADCCILVDKFLSPPVITATVADEVPKTVLEGTVDADQTKSDMRDLLVLYCVRRGTRYHSALCYLLIPLLLAPTPIPRSLASSCYYSLCATFLPLLDPKTPGLAIASRTLHSWFRLLLGYHYPRLMMHLDRVLYQGWEQAAPVLSPVETRKAKAIQQSALDLDAMENTILGIEEQETTSEITSVPSPLSFSRKKRSSRQLGLIPSSWLLGLFSGSLAPRPCCLLWDWVLLRGERYAGIYLATALLGHFEATLLASSGPQLEDWFLVAASECPDWFAELPSEALAPEQDKTSSFMASWTVATAALMRDTPRGLAVALEGLETWAELRQQSPLTGGLHKSGSFDSGLIFPNPAPVASNPAAALLGKVRGLGRKLRQIQGHSEDDDLDAWADEEDGPGVLREWLQDSLAGSACLLAEAAEVVPCVCASSRRDPTNSTEAGELYPPQDGRTGSRYLFSSSAVSPPSPPLLEYFAVDCRSSFERRVGCFPKALIFDPKALTDPDELSSLMSSLQPFMDSSHNLHVCLIGAGEAYIRMNIRLMRGEASAHGMVTGSGAEAERLVQEALAEQTVRLNAVAVFFMKRSFSRISVLYGGFAGAAKFLVSEQSPLSLSSALVDAHGPSIDMLLGGTDLLRQGVGRSGNAQAVDKGSRAMFPFANTEKESAVLGPGAVIRDNLTSVADKAKELAAEGAREVLGNLGNRLVSLRTATLASIKKKVSAGSDEKDASASAPESLRGPSTSAISESLEASKGQTAESASRTVTAGRSKQQGARSSTSTFTIDSDEEDNEAPENGDGGDKAVGSEETVGEKAGGEMPRIPDTRSISITRTEAEKSQALALHHLSGLRKGDSITISRECLPGAILFPALVDKREELEEGVDDLEESHGMRPSEACPAPAQAPEMVHRYLVVTRERFIIIDTSGGGVGSVGRVVANHHLTELLKMTFRKRDPDMVTIYFVSPHPEPKTKQFRVSKREEFVQCLQKHMQRFK